MKTVITGSCTAHRYQEMLDAIAAAELVGIVPTEVLTGGAAGVEEMALKWGVDNCVITHQIGTDYAKHGNQCHTVRNQEMIDQADALIVLWHHNDTRYLREIMDMARARGLPIALWEV